MRVVLAGGGSAGHIEPALALADALRQADRTIEVTCLGTERGLETRLVPLRGYELELIPAVPLPRSVTPQLLTVPGRLAGAVHERRSRAGPDRRGRARRVRRVRGDPGLPGGQAAQGADRGARGQPVARARQPARRAASPRTSSPATRTPSCRTPSTSGMPIRRQIAELDRLALGDKARAHFGLRPDLPVLLVTGGSQGARSLNRALAGALGAIRAAGVQVLHVAGPRNAAECPAAGRAAPYVARALRGPDGPGLRRRGLRAVPGRRDDLRRAHRRRPARRVCPAAARQRRAAAERAADRAARRRAASSTTPSCTPEWIADVAAAGAARHRAGRGDVGGGRAARPRDADAGWQRHESSTAARGRGRRVRRRPPAAAGAGAAARSR